MLVLPIRTRVMDQGQKGDDEEAEATSTVSDGKEKWSPQTTSTYEGAASAGNGSDLSDHRVTVKNTFIDVESPESHRVDFHRGAQSCTARIADLSQSGFVPSPCIREVEEDQVGVSSARRELRYDDVAEGATSASNLSAGCPAEMVPPPMPPPAPPSTAPPASRASGISSIPELGSGFDESKILVKNTFIELDADDQTPLVGARAAMSCVARFSDPASFPTASPAGGGRSLGAMQEATGPPHTAASAAALGQAPSEGSKVHGHIGEDGQIMCQPCAWFYKGAGCMNGLNCRYCHLCPQGELKNRKKQKIQRLRAQDAAVAATAAMQDAAAAATAAAVSAAGRESVARQALAQGGRISLSAALGQC